MSECKQFHTHALLQSSTVHYVFGDWNISIQFFTCLLHDSTSALSMYEYVCRFSDVAVQLTDYQTLSAIILCCGVCVCVCWLQNGPVSVSYSGCYCLLSCRGGLVFSDFLCRLRFFVRCVNYGFGVIKEDVFCGYIFVLCEGAEVLSPFFLSLFLCTLVRLSCKIFR